MEFEAIPYSTRRFKTYCPTCAEVGSTYDESPQSCKKCGDFLILINMNNLPGQYKFREGKIAIGAVILVVSALFPIILIIFFAHMTGLLIGLVCWMVGGITIGVYLMVFGWREYNEDERVLIEKYLPTDIASIPKVRGVKYFELGRLLAGEIYQCPDCGYILIRGAKFCIECGAKQI